MSKDGNNSNKCPICGRPTHKKSEYCIFHAGAEEKTEEEFKGALKEYIQKIKEEDKDYDFVRFIFIGDMIFKEDLKIDIFKNADFWGATFEGYADFGEVTFKGVALFGEVTFKGVADFMRATFEGHADFAGATFKGVADFEWATFKETFFGKATFEGDANFGKATFEGDAVFGEVTFKGLASFIKVGFQSDVEYINLKFKKNVNFTFAVFRGKANFKNIIFRAMVDFSNTEFKNPTYFDDIQAKKGISFGLSTFTSALYLDLICNKGIISFKGAFLENSFLAFNLGKETLIDFDYARLRNTEISKVEIEGHILQEKERKYKKAKEVYFILKKNFVTIGRYGDRGWALLKEKLMERMEYSFYEHIKKRKKDIKNNMLNKNYFLLIEFFNYLFSGDFLKWVNLYFMDVLLGYGEQPFKVIRISMFIILIFALIYSRIGISDPGDLEINSKIQNEISQGKVKIEGLTNLSKSEEQYNLKFESEEQKNLKIEIREFNLYEKKKNIPRKNFRDCLYFSLVIFTTLGLGDFHPLPECRIITGIEGLFGAILMGLFVAMLSRKFFGGQF